jgi:peptidoglycan/LPS O-acetylase OafA/YrhL
VVTSPPNLAQSKSERLHHLDALRATAMLLGIVLHASLAYTGGPWIVRDAGHPGFAVTFFAIHGFRMQLFFLLSGFFTALLWRRLRLAGLLKQRAARIALPLSKPVLGTSSLDLARRIPWQPNYVPSRGTPYDSTSNPAYDTAAPPEESEQEKKKNASQKD